METIVEDSQYIAKRANLTNFEIPWENKIEQIANSKIDYKAYMDSVDQADVEKLYVIYRLDFEMFGYSAKDYLETLP